LSITNEKNEGVINDHVNATKQATDRLKYCERRGCCGFSTFFRNFNICLLENIMDDELAKSSSIIVIRFLLVLVKGLLKARQRPFHIAALGRG